MKFKLFLALSAITISHAFAQSQITTTGNNLIDTSNPYAADIVIGSDANGGARHNASIMWWSNGSASRIFNTGDLFNFSVWNTTNANVVLNATFGGPSYFNGAVGIGTSLPASILHVAAPSGNQITFTNTSPTLVGNENQSLVFTGTNNTGSGATFDLFRVKVTSTNGGISAGNVNFIQNGSTTSTMTFLPNMNVGIGTTAPDEKLTVNGTIHACQVKVDTNIPVADYVFKKGYKLTTLTALKTYLDKNQHLPEIPSASEQEKEGLDLGKMNQLLLKKVEELTLYLIEKDKEINELKQSNAEIKHLKNEFDVLKDQLKS